MNRKESSIQQDFEDTFRYIYHEYSKDCDGEYTLNEVQSLWLGWKAAHSKYHKDVIVELPARQKYEEAGCYYDEMNSSEVIDALNKAGVKYK